MFIDKQYVPEFDDNFVNIRLTEDEFDLFKYWLSDVADMNEPTEEAVQNVIDGILEGDNQ